MRLGPTLTPHRLTLVAEHALPEHLLPDVEHTLSHVGWIGTHVERRTRRAPDPVLPDLAVAEFRGHTPPIVPVHEDHDHDALFADLIAGLRQLSVACLHVAGPLAETRPGLLVLDADSTLLNEEGLDELAALAGAGEEVAAVTDAAMRGELDFASALRRRVAPLAGTGPGLLDRARTHLSLTAGAPQLLAAARAAGLFTAVVSGGFHELLDPILDDLAVDYRAANRLAVDASGTLTGDVAGEILDAEGKAERLAAWAQKSGAAYAVAVGDGANDVDMVTQAAIGIGLAPKPALARAADAVVPFRRLDAVAELLALPPAGA